MTVLFCDLVGFTATSEDADPEDVRARIRPYHERLRVDIEHFGGTVEKFIGDAVMAVFGAPVTHEDDPSARSASGLRIIDSLAELNEADPSLGARACASASTPARRLVTLSARPELGEGIVAGDVVNTASRIQGARAGWMASRCPSDVSSQPSGSSMYEPLPSVELKGKAEPMALFRAVEARGSVRRGPHPDARSPFVGRVAEERS